jgi:hypothetical protein
MELSASITKISQAGHLIKYLAVSLQAVFWLQPPLLYVHEDAEAEPYLRNFCSYRMFISSRILFSRTTSIVSKFAVGVLKRLAGTSSGEKKIRISLISSDHQEYRRRQRGAMLSQSCISLFVRSKRVSS